MNKESNIRIKHMIDKLLEDYSDSKTINTFVYTSSPDSEKVKEILSKLIMIVYPGFYKSKEYKVYNVETMVSSLIEDVVYRLRVQIELALKHCKTCEDINIENKSEEIVTEFVKRIPKIRASVEDDVHAFYEGDPAAYSEEEIILCYPGLYAITVNRIAHELHLLGVPLIPRMMSEEAHSKTGIDIHPGTVIGKHFFIDHGTGIVIGETTEIGNNVKIYQGVTLGALSTRGGQSLKGKKRHPTIEDNVTIYSNASILGGDTIIGENAVIGSNTFITKSIPKNAKVYIKSQELEIKQGKEEKTQEVQQGKDW